MTTVHVHVHHCMAGTTPLRIADVLFTDDSVEIGEYATVTPMFGLVTGGHRKRAREMAQRCADEGPTAVLDHAERHVSLSYEDIESVRLYDGGRFGRPKLAIDTGDGPPYGYRIHAPVEVASLRDVLADLADEKGFDITVVEGVGFSPRESLRRFLVDR
ncbi:hypothetical protein [Haloarchaeobius sp. HME9146]|uniref:hypothetical protein n=1 Tax=Haloarchaeobius sp. HME9146 TaxID=2978732 RepID=UPI0021C1EBBF|nr:hypothetical protein [Haloarchaeobius sp. HME9146]MCT9097815.1 hypothetical protein [Haloarchaeobius sp. HME9146]